MNAPTVGILDPIEIRQQHLPHIYKSIVALAHEDEDDGTESLGSGVCINIYDRHFIATAAHCIKRNPRILSERISYDTKINVLSASAVEVKNKVCHDDLDIGFLELYKAIPGTVELRVDQLELNWRLPEILDTCYIWVVGFPVARLRKSIEQASFAFDLTRTAFATYAIEQNELLHRFDYKQAGYRFDPVSNLYESVLLESPKGYSGGGCFAIAKGKSKAIEVVSYKLYSIQHQWHETKRYVDAVPIANWLKLVELYK